MSPFICPLLIARQGRVPDGHIAMNRDRLWDAIDSAHELKPRSPGVRPAFLREATHMSKLWHLVMLAVVVACGISTIFSVDRNYRPIARIDPSQEPTKFAGSPQEPIVPAEPLDDVRKAERSRRAVRPAGDPKRENGLNYEGVLKGWEGSARRCPDPPSRCRRPTAVRSNAPRKTPTWATGPHDVHDLTVALIREQIRFRVPAHVVGSRMIAAVRSHRGTLTVSNWSAC